MHRASVAVLAAAVAACGLGGCAGFSAPASETELVWQVRPVAAEERAEMVARWAGGPVMLGAGDICGNMIYLAYAARLAGEPALALEPSLISD